MAGLAILPLLGLGLWSGYRLALTDPVLGVIAPIEQPLSVRSPGGVWAMGLALGWFGLAYRRRQFALWEAALVLLGGAAVLARVGNAWLDAVCLLAPLARQVAQANLRTAGYVAVAVLSLGATLAVVLITRPPAPPAEAVRQAMEAQSADRSAVFADWRWAAELQRPLGPDHQVLASRGPAAESTDFWLDYLRVSQGHERWAELLQEWNVNTVVLEASDQQRQVAGLIRTAADWRVIYDADGTLVAARVPHP